MIQSLLDIRQGSPNARLQSRDQIRQPHLSHFHLKLPAASTARYSNNLALCHNPPIDDYVLAAGCLRIHNPAFPLLTFLAPMPWLPKRGM